MLAENDLESFLLEGNAFNRQRDSRHIADLIIQKPMRHRAQERELESEI